MFENLAYVQVSDDIRMLYSIVLPVLERKISSSLRSVCLLNRQLMEVAS
jgi:hypothetical protein